MNERFIFWLIIRKWMFFTDTTCRTCWTKTFDWCTTNTRWSTKWWIDFRWWRTKTNSCQIRELIFVQFTSYQQIEVEWNVLKTITNHWQNLDYIDYENGLPEDFHWIDWTISLIDKHFLKEKPEESKPIVSIEIYHH